MSPSRDSSCCLSYSESLFGNYTKNESRLIEVKVVKAKNKGLRDGAVRSCGAGAVNRAGSPDL